MTRLLTSAVLIIGLTGTFAACGQETVDKGDLQTQVREALTKEVGQQAPEAECPEGLEAKVGATTRCFMDFPENKRLNITVKVKSVDGDTTRFDIAADEKLVEGPK